DRERAHVAARADRRRRRVAGEERHLAEALAEVEDAEDHLAAFGSGRLDDLDLALRQDVERRADLARGDDRLARLELDVADLLRDNVDLPRHEYLGVERPSYFCRVREANECAAAARERNFR